MTKRLTVFVFFLGCANMMWAQTSTSREDKNDVTPKRIEVEAEFLGGPGAWGSFLRKNLKAKVPLKNGAPAGTYLVVVRFIIGKDGRIGEITAETNYGYGMENELMRVIKKGPKWVPATLNGEAVRAYRRQPITFVVAEK